MNLLDTVAAESAEIIRKMRVENLADAAAPMTRAQIVAALFLDSAHDWHELEEAMKAGDRNRIIAAANAVAAKAQSDTRVARFMLKVASRASWRVLWALCRARCGKDKGDQP